MAADALEKLEKGPGNGESRRSLRSSIQKKIQAKWSETDNDVPFESMAVRRKPSNFNEHARQAIQKYRSKSKVRLPSRRGLTTIKPTQLKEVVGSSSDGVGDVTLPVFKKKDSEITLIRTAIDTSFFFDQLSDLERNQLIDAFEPFKVKKGNEIIKQGTDGDYFYILAKGEVSFIVKDVEVGKAESGASFGELALLYACPRAATVRAKTDVKLFRVEQKTFRALLRKQASESEKQKIHLLKSIDFFKEVGKSDLEKLSKAMTPRIFVEGECFYRKGGECHTFFVLQEGKVKAGEENLQAGDYFGDKVLSATEPQGHSATAMTKGVLFSIDRDVFEKVLGNVSELGVKSHDRQTLAELAIFKEAGLEEPQLEELAKLISDQRFEQGAKIFEDGRKTEAALYLVRKGHVELSGSRDGAFKAGTIFGEELLLLDTKHVGVPNVKTPSSTIARYTASVTTPSVCGILSLSDCRTVFDTSKMVDPDAPLSAEDDEAALFAAAAMAPSLGRETTQQWLASSSKESLRERIRKNVDLEDLRKHSVLGEGQFGKVFLVTADIGNQEINHFALKVQKKHNKQRKNSVKEIKAEIQVLALMDHPYIVPFLHHYEDEESLYILMGLVHGGELFDVIHQQGDDGLWYSGINEKDAKFYALVVADTLNYIHRKQFVYRDLKPENVLIDKDGYPIIVDFGFAKFTPDRTYTLCGTPNYLAPEVVLNRGHGACSDHWALGVVIYEMLAGENPFFNEGMDQMALFSAIVQADFYPLPNDVSDEAFYLIDELLEKKPVQRLGSLAGGGKDIVTNEWFKPLDLVEVRQKKHKAPFTPSNTALESLIEESLETSISSLNGIP